MDTRNKIIDLETALGLDRQKLAVAAGAFDVLQAAHARFLETIRPADGELLVVVWNDASLSQPILPERARAQLVAALRVVNYVVIAARGGELETLVQWAVPEERNIIGVVLERTAEERG
jgi:bifunctional ADP-heptose synthase (sugar kinase/adenylyltransferase)